MYVIVLAVVRIMGKREIGKLSPFDLVVAIMIAELAALPMEDPKIPLVHGLIPIGTLLVAQIVFSYACLWSRLARNIVCGRSSILIREGKIDHREMRKVRYNVDDLLTQLREKNYPNLADIEFAILENSGKLSIIPKGDQRPLRGSDMGLKISNDGFPLPLVIDGQVQDDHLHSARKDAAWLQQELSKKGVSSLKEVLLAFIDNSGQLHVHLQQA
ncbi:MAG: DUF421 domain-containing protein [Firmicutes bacterium]|nr:DUF421 domain-containing protein [Bacillota bacterium]